jgi:hypothetical protein
MAAEEARSVAHRTQRELAVARAEVERSDSQRLQQATRESEQVREGARRTTDAKHVQDALVDRLTCDLEVAASSKYSLVPKYLSVA